MPSLQRWLRLSQLQRGKNGACRLIGQWHDRRRSAFNGRASEGRRQRLESTIAVNLTAAFLSKIQIMVEPLIQKERKGLITYERLKNLLRLEL